MKRPFLFSAVVLVLALQSPKVFSQWNTAGSGPDVYLNSGEKAGIGTTAPAAPLHIVNNNLLYNTTSPNTTGLLLENNTDATSAYNANLQASPPIILAGNMWNYLASPQVSQRVQFKIDAAAYPAYPANSAAKTFNTFRIQKLSGGAYTEFFSVDNPSAPGAGTNLSLQGTRVVGVSGSGVALFSSASTTGGNLGFYNNDGSVCYGFISNATAMPAAGSPKNVAGTMVLGASGNINNVNPYALLDMVGSSNPSLDAKGFMMPRMNSARMTGITGSSPVALAEGLQVYNNETHAPYYYDGTKWNRVGDGASSNPNVLYVSPLQFGARFNGIDDDIDALDATYAYCNSLAYDKIVVIQLPPGVCRITRPWVIGAYYMDESNCFTNLFGGYGHDPAPIISAAASTANAQAKPVSIEGSGATAIYLDFNPTTLKAGIYYSAMGNNGKNIEMYRHHISGIGVYGQGYFVPDPADPEHHVIPKYPRTATYASVNNNLMGILCLNNSLEVNNCILRDLKEGIVFNNCGAPVFKNSSIIACRRGYYCWQAHGGTIENVNADVTERGFEIRSGAMTITNVYARFCPTAIWKGAGGTATFTACYLECGNYAVSGTSQLVIGDDPEDPLYSYFTQDKDRAVDAIVFNSLTIAPGSPAGTNDAPTAFSLWMKKTAKRVAINGGYLQSSYKKLTADSENELMLQGVAGTFTDLFSNNTPTGNLNLTGKVFIQDANATYKTMKLTAVGMGSSSNGDGTRHLCLDDKGNIVLCPTTP